MSLCHKNSENKQNSQVDKTFKATWSTSQHKVATFLLRCTQVPPPPPPTTTTNAASLPQRTLYAPPHPSLTPHPHSSAALLHPQRPISSFLHLVFNDLVSFAPVFCAAVLPQIVPRGHSNRRGTSVLGRNFNLFSLIRLHLSGLNGGR